ncbi:hypothetical protein PPTG_24997 [Phytophthora nicotianae INRA-310]|uniref:Uncharacterized protein n=1 Tax=Phytophthora nicotianae (strain INRA-310) TaxID=761204 RepID=W2PBJ5_PHYN3|nr:hypothetical protein PPTG_24997 [Phytophthora nicotianae INRA-310]ETM97349.1 hypothetical protein PPTG_24997 [Phytophthora nicotianae INRA-310]
MNRSQIGNTYSTICSKLCAVRWFHRKHRWLSSSWTRTSGRCLLEMPKWWE